PPLIWPAERRVRLCGDTLEDTVTYVDEPEHFDTHLANLEGLRELGAERILPNHGDPDVIAGGGYGDGFITATERYIEALQRGTDAPLREVVADSLREGVMT